MSLSELFACVPLETEVTSVLDMSCEADDDLFSVVRKDSKAAPQYRFLHSQNFVVPGMTEERYQMMRKKRMEERMILEESKREVMILCKTN